jgi:hypothetical protein
MSCLAEGKFEKRAGVGEVWEEKASAVTVFANKFAR